MKEYKQAIVIRIDLDMSPGKMAAQAAHASLEAYKKSKRDKTSWVSAWDREGCKKVVLQAGGLTQLEDVFKKAIDAGLPCALITDAGYTEIPKGSVTAVAIGPAPEDKINKVTGSLRSL